MLIAQITDAHVRRKRDLLHHMIHAGRELRRCVEIVNGLSPQPNFVVATGDPRRARLSNLRSNALPTAGTLCTWRRRDTRCTGGREKIS
jgi:hypothetical protein